MFETKYYTVNRIDGDYAYLLLEDQPELEEKCVARALLPAEIQEGSRLKYEMMSYSMC
ncbi:MAG: chorismate--pyruvate lyase [Lachnospiraceae bacterium]|nr:chorismate--pyruvate lyase [Lachnospiraceae bacterium]